MGFEPPKDAPSPAVQDAATASASFEPTPGGLSLCGFSLPFFKFNLSITLPAIPFPPFPPTFNFALGLNCDLSHPLSAEFEFGGKRVPVLGPDLMEDK